MKDSDIAVLAKNLPDLFELRPFTWDKEEDWIVIQHDNTGNTLSEEEEAMFGEVSDEKTHGGESIDQSRNPLDWMDPLYPDDPWPDQNRQRDIKVPKLGDDFPGGPVLSGTVVPPPDCLAFYLPFHHFSRETWGIYLLAEGVDELAKDLVAITNGYLTRREALVAARAYLFHHEAYHSAIEAFGTRLEVSHRLPIYLDGLRTLYKRQQFEEALATAYGLNCVKSSVLAGRKRTMAVAALTRYHVSCPTPYNHGHLYIGTKRFQPAEAGFLEEALRLSVPGIRAVHESTWAAASYMTMPAVRRGGKFSYAIEKSSPLYKRSRLNVKYFDRRKLLSRLREEIGGKEIGGGRHPKWQSATGKKVPIPYGKEVDRGTAAAILQQFGISARLEDFLAAR